MNFGQFQSQVWHTLDGKTTQIWWLVDMEYKHSTLWLLYVMLLLLFSFDVFVPTSAHLLIFLNKWFVQIYSNVNATYNIALIHIKFMLIKLHNSHLKSWSHLLHWSCSKINFMINISPFWVVSKYATQSQNKWVSESAFYEYYTCDPNKPLQFGILK